MDNKKDYTGKEVLPVKKDKIEIGIDTSDELLTQLVNLAESDSQDFSDLNQVPFLSQSRDQFFSCIDAMCADSDVAAILETYLDEVCEAGPTGDIMWVEAEEPQIQNFISYILKSLQVNKNIRSWTEFIIKYGDCFLKTFRKNDKEQPNIIRPSKKETLIEELNKLTDNEVYYGDKNEEETIPTTKTELKESVIVKTEDKRKKFNYYVEVEKNPAEMYELTQRGKTAGYLKTPINTLAIVGQSNNDINGNVFRYNYKLKNDENDIELYEPTRYVHGCLDFSTARVSEEVTLASQNEDDPDLLDEYTFTINRGQSLFAPAYKAWRALKLLDTAVMLNRITRSSVLRILQLEVGDMSPNAIKSAVAKVKTMIEQKAAINIGDSMSEYTMPGPVVNTIYLPTKGEIGKITATELGSQDVDPKSLLDIDYFNNKFYGALRVPKAWYNFTDDGAGFNGGTSLAIISSRFGKAVKRIQNVDINMVTDLVNIYLLDAGLSSYIGKFKLKMQAPMTQEELDRQKAESDRVNAIRDLLGVVKEELDNPIAKLKAVNVLIQNVDFGGDLSKILNDEIKRLETSNGTSTITDTTNTEETETTNTLATPSYSATMESPRLSQIETAEDEEGNIENIEEPTGETTGEETLPSPSDLGIEDITVGV